MGERIQRQSHLSGLVNLQGDYTNTAGNVLTANHNLTLSTTGNLTNTGTLAAVNSLTLNAANVDNQSTGLINSGATTVQASNAITNTGRIYGDDIALGTQSLTNDVDVTSGQAGAIAARNSINIGAATVVNREHAIIQSLSDMTFGRTLDVNHKAIGTAGSITNSSATIDAGGNLVFQTAQLNNTNAHFATTQQVDPTLTTQVTQYASWVAPTTWYNPNQVTWGDSGDGGIVLIDPSGGRFEKFYKQDYTQTVSKTVVTSSDPGKISSGGGMVLSGNITNDKSTIIAGGTLSGTTGNINNIGATGEIDTVNHMTANENYYHYVNGHPHENHYDYDNGGAAYDVTLPSTPLALNVWTVQQNTAPNSGANPALGQGVGATAVPTVGGLTLGVNQGSQTVTGASGHGVTTAGGTAGSGAAETVASLNRDTANSQTSAQRQDVQAMQQEAQAAQTIKQTLITQATKFTDEAYRTAFLKSADVYVVEKDADGVVTARQLSDEEKQNLQPAADGKVHVADNGIFNDLDGATKYADQHSSAVDGPQYLIHFDIANNALSELMIAGYQKYLEGDVMGLTNATQETKSVMQQYGENGLVLDGHSRGAMTVGNAMESMQNQPDAQGSLSDTLVHFYGPAYNAVKADNILGNLQNRDAISDPTQKNNMVLTYENNIADPVGRLIGGNPPTGGTIPDGSSILFQALRAATGQPVTSHNCYGASGNENCGKFWQDSPTMTPVPQAVRHY